MQEQIKTENLCKRYGSLVALDQASIAAYPAECLGIFGFSGSGKSTLLRVLAGIETPDSGAVADVTAGISFQSPSFDERQTPFEALWLYATLYEIPRGKRHAAIRELLSLIGLDSRRDRPVRELSAGAKKSLEVAKALLSPSDILLLDEPMTGLDSEMRRRLWERLLLRRTHEKTAVVLATSRSEDAELCDRIALFHEGRILVTGTISQLRGMVGPEALVVKPMSARGGRIREWNGVVGREQDGSLVVELGPESRPVELLRQIPGDIAAVRYAERSLDSILAELIVHPELLPQKSEEHE